MTAQTSLRGARRSSPPGCDACEAAWEWVSCIAPPSTVTRRKEQRLPTASPAVRHPGQLKAWGRSTFGSIYTLASGTESVPVISSETAPPHEPSGVQCQPEQLLPSSRASVRSVQPPQEVVEELRFARLSRLAWATLYERVFDIDPLQCSSCGGRMRFVEVIEDVGRARSDLHRRGLPADPPPLSRARSPDWAD